jgi:perosamine synthetase
MISMTNVKIDDESIRAVGEVLRSGQLAQGPKVEEFEKAFAGYLGVKYAVAVNSGTAALHIALMAAGIGPGDEVITTPFSFIATANCCLYCNAIPVFADIDTRTFNLSPDLIEKKITSQTKAVILVDLYGQSCDMEEITNLCRKHHLNLIEDACQAHGAEYRGKKVGSFGTGCFSFYPTKNMTTGEGGMITTNDVDIFNRSRMIRQHGQIQRYVHDTLGYNFRMTDISATLGIYQLKNLDINNSKRIQNAVYLSEHIGQIKGLVPPFIALNRNHVFHQYTIRVTSEYQNSRDELQKLLSSLNIGSQVHYPIPIHKQPVYLNMGYTDNLPNTELAAKEVLSLPVHPGLAESDLKTIVEVLRGR